MRRVGNPTDRLGYNLRDWAWGVPLISVLTIVSEKLLKLRVVGISTERLLDSLRVENVGIRGQLNSVVRDPLVEFAHECLRILA